MSYGEHRLSPVDVTLCSFCSGAKRDIIEEMPSPVGHALAGIALGSLAGRDRGWGVPLVCGFVAALADVDFLLPVVHRGPTHSLTAGVVVFAVALATLRLPGPTERPVRVAAAISLAALSHVLLDWLGEDSSTPRGLMAFWPFSSEYYISGLDLFDAVSRRYWREGFWRHNMIAVAKEVIILLPLVLLARRRRVSTYRNPDRSFARGGRQPPSV